MTLRMRKVIGLPSARSGSVVILIGLAVGRWWLLGRIPLGRPIGAARAAQSGHVVSGAKG